MQFGVRDIEPEEWPLLEDFLYEAIYIPEDFVGEVPRTIIYVDPWCRAAFEGFGTRPDDRGVVATVGGRVVGACWARTTNEYGHIDDNTPSLSISLYKPYRGQCMGTAMMHALLGELCDAGYARASLSVQKQNPALRLYERAGFRLVERRPGGPGGRERVEAGGLGAPLHSSLQNLSPFTALRHRVPSAVLPPICLSKHSHFY